MLNTAASTHTTTHTRVLASGGATFEGGADGTRGRGGFVDTTAGGLDGAMGGAMAGRVPESRPVGCEGRSDGVAGIVAANASVPGGFLLNA